MAYGDQTTPIQPESLPAEQQKKVLLEDDPWSDDRAKRIVKSDFAYAEAYRTNAHDWRYRNADELYLGWVGQRYWDGTRVPRSSLGVPVSFMQVESLLPKLVKSVSSPDSFHFYSELEMDDEDLIVQAWKEMTTRQLEETHWRAQLKRALKSMAQQGNGILEVGFEDYEDEYISIERKVTPTRMAIVNHPLQGPMQVPAETKEDFSRSIKKDRKSRPYVRYISVKDFYVNPNSESEILQEAGYTIHRVYMTAGQIKALGKSKGFNIPDDDTLTQMSMAKSTANQDVTKLSAELYRYNMWNPSQDYSSDPSQKRIEVICYTTPGRKIWLLGREEVIYNQPNRYGEINYWSVSYADVLDRWHALSICDVVEGEQRLQQATINARIDELALALHPPINKRRGVTIPAYQLKVRPGVVREVENPETDVMQQPVSNITQQAFVEVQASELRTQKITGLSDLAGQGVPTSGGNSANRTATGINTQTGATQDRVGYLVENVEDMLIEPVVSAVLRYNKKFLDLKSASNWLKMDKRFSKLDPAKVMNARIGVECRGSIKMAARMQFLQAFPTLAQIYFNPEFLQLLAQQQQMTLNVKEVGHRLDDALNYGGREPLFVQMSQQQVQAMQQPPAAEMMKAQLQQMQMQSDDQINSKNLIAKLMTEFMKQGFNAHTEHAKMDDKHIQEMAKLLVAIHQSGQERAAAESSDSGQSQ